MKRVFVDANIVVDLLCERYPWTKKTFGTSEIPVYDLDEFMTLIDNE